MLRIRSQQVATCGVWLLIAASLVACDRAPAGTVQPQTDQTVEPNPEATVGLAAGAANEWRTFRNEKFRYTIDVPPGWTIDESAKNEVIIAIGPANGQAGLHILALELTSTMNDFVLENHRFHQRRAAVYFETLSSDEVQMTNGPTARRVAYRIQNDRRFCTEILIDYLLLAGNLSFALQGSMCMGAEGLFGEDLEIMQRSFRLDSDLAMAPVNLFLANQASPARIR